MALSTQEILMLLDPDILWDIVQNRLSPLEATVRALAQDHDRRLGGPAG